MPRTTSGPCTGCTAHPTLQAAATLQAGPCTASLRVLSSVAVHACKEVARGLAVLFTACATAPDACVTVARLAPMAFATQQMGALQAGTHACGAARMGQVKILIASQGQGDLAPGSTQPAQPQQGLRGPWIGASDRAAKAFAQLLARQSVKVRPQLGQGGRPDWVRAASPGRVGWAGPGACPSQDESRQRQDEQPFAAAQAGPQPAPPGPSGHGDPRRADDRRRPNEPG